MRLRLQGLDNRWSGIHHVTFVTPDLDGTIRFYRDALELGLLFVKESRLAPDDQLWRHCFLDAGNGAALHVFEYSGAVIHPHVPDGRPWFDGGLQQVALSVPDETALRGLQEHLRELGIGVSDVEDFGQVRAIHLRDNNGMQLEVACWAEDLAQGPLA